MRFTNSVTILSLFVSVCISVQAQAQCKLQGVSGSHPSNICSFYSTFKVDLLNAQKVTVSQNENRILLHGKPGNGKTTYAVALARSMNRKFVQLNAGNIVDAYSGNGVKKIIELISNAKQDAQQNGVKSLIFIDEIESLTAFIDLQHRTEHRSTAAQLWTLMDEHNTDFDIIFVFATNNVKNISGTFLSRFWGTHIIEIPVPENELRLKIIADFFLADYPRFEGSMLNNTVQKYLNEYSNALDVNLKALRSGLQDALAHATDQKNIEKLQGIVLALEAKITMLEKLKADCPSTMEKYNALLAFDKEAKSFIADIRSALLDLHLNEFEEHLKVIELLPSESITLLVKIFELAIDLNVKVGSITDKNTATSFNAYLLEQKKILVQLEQDVKKLVQQSSFAANKNAHKFCTNMFADVACYVNNIDKYLESYDKIPSAIVLNMLVGETKALSIRSLTNLKSKINALIIKGNDIVCDNNRRAFFDALKTENETITKWTKEQNEEARQLLNRLELLKAFKQVECGNRPAYECSERVNEIMGFKKLKQQVIELAKS